MWTFVHWREMLVKGVCNMFINVRQRAVIRAPDTHHNAYSYFANNNNNNSVALVDE
jgi:hypothetical protein